MDSEVCGNCISFSPGPGEKFFNCTGAFHAGLKYGMQVRADSQSCEAFRAYSPLLQSQRASPASPGSWTRFLPLLIILLGIAVLSWGISSLFTSEATSGQNGGTIPISTPGPTPLVTASPAPTTPPTMRYFDIGLGQWATAQDRMIMIVSTQRMASYQLFTGRIEQAPPGTVFIFINVTFTNMGNANISVTPTDFLLEDDRGTNYSAHAYDYYHVGKAFPTVDVAPGDTVNGKVFWIVPEHMSGFQVSYLLEPRSQPPVSAVWVLPW